MEVSPYIHPPFKIATSQSNGLRVKDVVKLCASNVSQSSQVFAMELRYYHDLAKRLSHYLYFFSFLFLFFDLGLTTQREVWESVMSQVSHSHSHSVTSHDVT